MLSERKASRTQMDTNGVVAYSDAKKLAVWKAHYEKLLNVEFPRDSDYLYYPQFRVHNHM